MSHLALSFKTSNFPQCITFYAEFQAIFYTSISNSALIPESSSDNGTWVSTFLQGLEILAFRHHLFAFSYYHVHPQSKMVAKTAFNSSFNCIFWLFVLSSSY